MANIPWRWNYFTLESLSKVKCSLCDSDHKLRLDISTPLKAHLKKKIKDKKHYEAFLDVSKNLGKNLSFTWDSHYKIISSNIILKPNIQCVYCEDYIPMPSDKPFLHAPQDFNKHLKGVHKIEYRNWKALETWIREKAESYYNIMQPRNQVIKVDTCRKCHVEIGAKNAIMFVKHLIDKHSEQIQHFPSDIIPRELLLYEYDSNDSFGDISTDDSEAANNWEVLISTSNNRPSTSSNQPSTSSNLPSEPRNIPSTSKRPSKEKLQKMGENLKRTHEFSKNTVKILKKTRKK